MIVISNTNNSITIAGHAYHAKPGEDIVCAAVSILVHTLVCAMETLTADKIECETNEECTVIKFRNLSERGILLVDSFFVGAKEIAEAYPGNVRVM